MTKPDMVAGEPDLTPVKQGYMTYSSTLYGHPTVTSGVINYIFNAANQCLGFYSVIGEVVHDQPQQWKQSLLDNVRFSAYRP